MLIHESKIALLGRNGSTYDLARVYADAQPDGTWQGWIEFVTKDGRGRVQTERETTQSSAEGIAYWASGLEAIYFEGALERAVRRSRARSGSPATP